MTKQHWGRIAAVVAGLVCLGAVVLVWRSPRVQVETAVVRSGSVVVEVVEDGRTRVIDRYLVSAPVAGSLERITLRPGDPVQAGQVVARLVPAPASLLDPRTRAEAEARRAAALDAARRAQSAATAAELAADLAARESERIRSLGEAATPQQVDQATSSALLRNQELVSARFARQVAGHEVESAQALLGRRGRSTDRFDLTSPVSGVVLAVDQGSAAVVAPGTPLLEIGDPAGLEVVVDALTSDAVRIKPGSPVVLERWGGEPLAAHVDSIEPQAFSRMSALGVEEQRVNVVVRIDTDRARWTALGDAYRVEARIEVERADGVLVVPESTLLRITGAPAVFRVQRRTAVLSPVELGRRNGVVAEVKTGVAEGDLVIVHPSEAVQDGGRVRE